MLLFPFVVFSWHTSKLSLRPSKFQICLCSCGLSLPRSVPPLFLPVPASHNPLSIHPASKTWFPLPPFPLLNDQIIPGFVFNDLFTSFLRLTGTPTLWNPWVFFSLLRRKLLWSPFFLTVFCPIPYVTLVFSPGFHCSFAILFPSYGVPTSFRPYLFISPLLAHVLLPKPRSRSPLLVMIFVLSLMPLP